MISLAASLFLPMVISAVLGAAAGITNPKTAGKQMDVLGKVMESVASFASALSSMQDLMPAKPPSAGAAAKTSKIMPIVADLAGAISEHFPTVAEAIVGMFKKGGALRGLSKYRKDIKTLASVFESVGKFVEAIGKLQDFEAAAGGAGNVGPLLTRLGSIVVDNKTAITTLLGSFGGLKVKKKFPKDAFKNFGDFISGGLTPFITAVNNMPTATESKLTSIQTDFDKFKKTLQGVTKSRVLTDAVKVTNQLGKHGKVTVEGLPKGFTLKINVSMDAQKVAKAVVKTGEVACKA